MICTRTRTRVHPYVDRTLQAPYNFWENRHPVPSFSSSSVRGPSKVSDHSRQFAYSSLFSSSTSPSSPPIRLKVSNRHENSVHHPRGESCSRPAKRSCPSGQTKVRHLASLHTCPV